MKECEFCSQNVGNCWFLLEHRSDLMRLRVGSTGVGTGHKWVAGTFHKDRGPATVLRWGHGLITFCLHRRFRCFRSAVTPGMWKTPYTTRWDSVRTRRARWIDGTGWAGRGVLFVRSGSAKLPPRAFPVACGDTGAVKRCPGSGALQGAAGNDRRA